MKNVIKVALLINDTPVPEVVARHGDYLEIFTRHLRDSVESYPDESVRGLELVVDGYEVREGKFPEVEGYDAVMMTGSASSAYEPLPWITRLISFIRDLITDPSKSHTKVIGICFGMQILALATGSIVAPNPAGWELGIYDVDLTPCGRDWLARVLGGADREGKEVPLLAEGEVVEKVDAGEVVKREQEVLHRDHVTSLPANTELLGSTPKCPVQGFIQYYPSSSPSLPRKIHILALQGHPELIPDIVNRIIDVRSAKGVLDEPTTREARERVGREMVGGMGVVGKGGNKVDGLNGLIGRGVVGWAVVQVLLE
ncbi:hypothetical protein QFC20_001617 [Naganishia adeliensis]|uniref:Uncharacterized protein n=1 Tax=Naganishia adeliensis TaxID=92952 RepID=A0ACC2WTG1_9TREE|nr:hypothetical protein QFC20_001617 [Naganishia adeliensis]